MSTITASPASDYGMMSRLIADSATVRQRLDILTQQAGNGLIGDTYAGLGTGAPTSLSLRPQLGNIQTWQANIDAATGRMAVTQSAMTQIQSIAANFYAQLNNLGGMPASEIDSVASAARTALSQVADLLDSRDGDVYVFSGQDSATPPIDHPDSILTSGFYTQINAAVGNLAGVGAVATAAATLGIAGSNAPGTSPFSTYLSQSAAVLQPQIPTIQVGEHQAMQVGLLASTNASVVSSGGSTTTSYMRDVLRALATIGSFTSADATVPEFQDLVQDTRTSLSGAISAMASDAGVLGTTQSTLATIRSQLSDTATALTGQVTSAEDVDMAATLSQLSLVQTQMQASYQVIAGFSGLSLVKFLPSP